MLYMSDCTGQAERAALSESLASLLTRLYSLRASELAVLSVVESSDVL